MPEINRFTQAKTTNKLLNKNQKNNKTIINTKIEDQKDKLDIKTNNKSSQNLKKGLIISSIAAAAVCTIAYIKNPDKAKDFIGKVGETIKKSKAKIATVMAAIVCGITGTKKPDKTEDFDHEKIFDSPININDYYKKVEKDLDDVKLKTAFDKDNITDEEIVEHLEKCGIYFNSPEVFKNCKSNPAVLHAVNLMSALENDAGMGGSCKREYLENLDPNTTTVEDVDIAFKFLTKKLEETPNIFLYREAFKNLAKTPKKVIALEEIHKDILKRCGFPEYRISEIDIFNALKTFDTSDDYDETIKFLGTLQKGTLTKGGLFGLQEIQFEDTKKARKFYESLNDNIIEKINLHDIKRLLEIEDKSSIEISKILNEIPESALKQYEAYELPIYVEFKDFSDANNISELTMEQKRKLLKQLVSSNVDVFLGGKRIASILPENQEEYCTLLDELAKSIGVNTKSLNQKELSAFNKGLDDISQSIQDVNLNNAHFELSFSRKDFIEEITKELKNLNNKEKKQVMVYFGFEITDGKLKGYPTPINDDKKLAEISSPKVLKAIGNIKPVVDRFSSKENTIKVTNGTEEFNKDINEILKGLPELKTTIGKSQHGTHAFTLDIHTFKVLQQVCSNPKFKDLSPEDKKTLEIASLLHDITKLEGTRDFMHPVESSFDAYYIIQKLNLPEEQQLKIYELIKTHNWLQLLNNPKTQDMVENIAQDIAFDTRHTNTFELAKILCEADMKSVKKDDSFFNNYAKTLKEMSAKVDKYVEQIHKTQIILPQTKIPKASEVKFAETMTKDGVTNKVLYFDELDDDLSKYGFAPGTTKSNWMALVHALDHPEQMGKFKTFNVIDAEALLSTSLMTPKEYKVFRKQGLIIKEDCNDIHAGYESDFGTGCEKTIELIKRDYLFYNHRKDNKTKSMMGDCGAEDRTQYREFFPKSVQKELHLTPKEYYERIKSFPNSPSLTDIEKIDKEFADGLHNSINNMNSRNRKFGRKYNEILVSRPKIQGTFAYDKKYEDIPYFLRKYAQDNDKLLIIFGPRR